MSRTVVHETAESINDIVNITAEQGTRDNCCDYQTSVPLPPNIVSKIDFESEWKHYSYFSVSHKP